MSELNLLSFVWFCWEGLDEQKTWLCKAWLYIHRLAHIRLFDFTTFLKFHMCKRIDHDSLKLPQFYFQIQIAGFGQQRLLWKHEIKMIHQYGKMIKFFEFLRTNCKHDPSIIPSNQTTWVNLILLSHFLFYYRKHFV